MPEQRGNVQHFAFLQLALQQWHNFLESRVLREVWLCRIDLLRNRSQAGTAVQRGTFRQDDLGGEVWSP